MTTAPLRVLVVTPKGDLGGAERWLLAVGDATDRLALSVAVLEPGPVLAALEERGWPTFTRRTGKSLRGLWRGYRWLGSVIRHTRPDVILLNGVKPGLLAMPWARRLRIPMVLVKHGTAFERSLAPVVARASSACIAVSAEHARTLPAAKTTVIPPARPTEVGSRLRGATQPLTLFMATRLVPNKGVDTAIAATAQAGWNLLVVGPDDATAPGERQRLMELARDHGVSARCRLLGEMQDLGQCWEQVDAAAVLSRPDAAHPTPAEGFGMVVVEAAAAGVPVIADADQVPSVAALRGDGVVDVDSEDLSSVVAALRALADPERRVALSQAGLTAAAAHPGPAQVADRVADVLAGVV